MERIKVLLIGDGVVPTGFSRVMHSIFENFEEDKYDIHHLAINYRGDPHSYSWKIYPAGLGGDAYGFNRIALFAKMDFDIIFILNDLWVVSNYLNAIKQTFQKLPKIVTYSPIDGWNQDPGWFSNFDIVTAPVVYTKFGQEACKDADSSIDFRIIPHGVNTNVFYKLEGTKEDRKKLVYPNKDEYINSFIVLNVNRNQPRKRLDVALEGFKLFAEDKPSNVKYYHHAGIVDVGWRIIELARYLKIEEKLIITSMSQEVQQVSDAHLNRIYNATDVGLNTSLGEGWGLCNVEHAATGAPQIVPGNSASMELFSDCGWVMPPAQRIFLEKTNTEGILTRPEDVAEALNNFYSDKKLYEKSSRLCYEKFTKEELQWPHISETWKKLFDEVL